MTLKLWIAALALALTLGTAFARPAVAAAKDCAAPLDGPGRPIAIPEPLSESDRIDLSTLVFRMLAKPAHGERPERLVAHAPACPLGVFTTGGSKLTLFAGASPLPRRWVSEGGQVGFYLTGGDTDAIARKFGVTTKPYLLVLAGDRLRYVLKLYDGAPSDEAIKAAIVASVEGLTSASLPFAAYDVESDAVSLLAKTASGVNAQLFGPTPDGSRTAVILYADGHYFTAGRSGEILMREAGVACPPKLGELGKRWLIVVYGAAGALDLACEYSSDEASVTVFAMRAPGLTAENTFQVRKSAALKRHGARETPLLVDVNGASRFEYGASWLDANGRGAGIWVGRKGDFVVDVEATWKLEAFRKTGEAIRRVDRMLSP